MPDDQQLFEAAIRAKSTPERARLAVSLLDLTSLNGDETPDDIEHLCRRASTPVGPVAAVCVFAGFVERARRALAGSGVRVATVVNFPGGESDSDAVLAETALALDAGADEIDVVLPHARVLDGDTDGAMTLVERVCEACRERAKVKLILETGRLADPGLIGSVSRRGIAAGVDFLKTSTGKIDTHATLQAAAAMLDAIREHREAGGRTVGLKPSGGIRTADEAARYLALAEGYMGAGWPEPATFRFGASSLLDALLDTLGHAGDRTGGPREPGSY